MKKIFSSAIAMLFLPVLFFSCNGKDETIPVESVTLNHSATTRIADYSFRLDATVLPEDATNKEITWSSSNNANVQIVQGSIRISADYRTNDPIQIMATTEGGVQASCNVTVAKYCGNRRAGFTNLGTVSFKSDKVWKVGDQEWSDVVMASNCSNREQFDGFQEGSRDSYNMDCRSNPGYGDLFSWCAVVGFQDELCPYPWRVPTQDDFVALDKALGGTGEARPPDSLFVKSKYIDIWGCAFGGECDENGALSGQGRSADYWTQSQVGISNVVPSVHLSRMGHLSPAGSMYKDFGTTLRCIKGN